MKAALAFIFALILGYSTFWIVPYVAIFDQGTLVSAGRLSRFEVPCGTAKAAEAECTNMYRIPYELHHQHEWLGAGVIISASRFYCSGHPEKAVEFDNPNSPGRRFGMMQLYQTIDLHLLKCQEDLIVEAWSRPGAVRKGHQEGDLVFGTYSTVERLRSLFQFLNVDLIRLMVALFLLLVVSYRLMSKFFMRSINEGAFLNHRMSWILFLFFTSDLPQLVFPVTQFPLLFNKASAIFSLSCHILSMISLMQYTTDDTVREQRKTGNLLIIYALIAATVVSPWFSQLFIAQMMAFAMIGLISGLIKRNIVMSLFAVTMFIASLKVLNVKLMPSALLPAYYVATYLLLDFISRLRSIGKLLDQLICIETLNSDVTTDALSKIERDMITYLDVKKLTFLHLGDQGRCEIRQYRIIDQQVTFQSYERDSLPPLFAYVISSQESLWNADASGKVMKQVISKRTTPVDYETNIFCAVPILHDDQVLGALALTDFEPDRFLQREKMQELKIYLDLVMRAYAGRLASKRIHLQKDMLSIARGIDQEVVNIKRGNYVSSDFNHVMLQMLKHINKTLETRGFIGKLEPQSRKVDIVAIDGHLQEIEQRYVNGAIYALEENRHGPLPLAINTGKTIVIPDVKLWKDVFHEFTNFFFEKSGTQSCVAIPIFSHQLSEVGIPESPQIWGAIFLERSTRPSLNNALDEIYKSISIGISSLIMDFSKRKMLEHTHKTLTEFIPVSSLSCVMENIAHEEKDRGYLLMLDLAGSTRVVTAYGRAHWEQAANIIKDKIIALSGEYRMTLRDFKWDAYHLTLSDAQKTNDSLELMLEFISRIKTEIDREYRERFALIHDYLIPETPKARFCITYGDISRGVNHGATKSWSVTGEEMAHVTKLEGVCKDLQKKNPYQFIFADESAIDPELSEQWQECHAKVPSNGRSIYARKWSWISSAVKPPKSNAA